MFGRIGAYQAKDCEMNGPRMFCSKTLKVSAALLSAALLSVGTLMFLMEESLGLKSLWSMAMVEFPMVAIVGLSMIPVPMAVFGKWRVAFEFLALSWLAVWTVVFSGMILVGMDGMTMEMLMASTVLVEMLVLPSAWIFMGRGRAWLAARCMDYSP